LWLIVGGLIGGAAKVVLSLQIETLEQEMIFQICAGISSAFTLLSVVIGITSIFTNKALLTEKVDMTILGFTALFDILYILQQISRGLSFGS